MLIIKILFTINSPEKKKKLFIQNTIYNIIMSETILRRAIIESVKNPRYNIRCFDIMLIFPN